MLSVGRHFLESPLKKGFHASVVVGLKIKRPAAGLLHPFGGIEPGEADEPQAASVPVKARMVQSMKLSVLWSGVARAKRYELAPRTETVQFFLN